MENTVDFITKTLNRLFYLACVRQINDFGKLQFDSRKKLFEKAVESEFFIQHQLTYINSDRRDFYQVSLTIEGALLEVFRKYNLSVFFDVEIKNTDFDLTEMEILNIIELKSLLTRSTHTNAEGSDISSDNFAEFTNQVNSCLLFISLKYSEI